MDTCKVCGRMYPAFYIQKHKCKGKPKVVKEFSCHLCDTICSYKSNMYRHYKKIHKLEKEEVPLAKVKVKRESRPLIPCPVCTKPITQLCRHACPGQSKPGPSQPKKAVSADRARKISYIDSDYDTNSNSNTSTNSDSNSKKQANKAVRSLDRPKRITRSLKAINLEDESSASSGSETSVSSYCPSRSPSPKPKKAKPCPKSKKPRNDPSNSSTISDEESDLESDDSNASRDSILNPRKGGKGKGQSRKGKGKALPLPPRKATWRSASDIPDAIKENIMETYGHYQFSSILDHQVRRCLENLNQAYWVQLLANSVGRCSVDAINLIKLVYDSKRSRPRYVSPDPPAAE